MPRLKKKYTDEVVQKLKEKFGYTNYMMIPKIVKVTVNCGLGEAVTNAKLLDSTVEELSQITGQKPVITKAKKSIAGFKIRAGMSIGTKVTLRRKKMWYFLDKLMNVALPRIRDFRGVNPNAFDGRGNYSMGFEEQLIFPEISYDSIVQINGMNVCITTTAKTDEEGRELLRLCGMPFKK